MSASIKEEFEEEFKKMFGYGSKPTERDYKVARWMAERCAKISDTELKAESETWTLCAAWISEHIRQLASEFKSGGEGEK